MARNLAMMTAIAVTAIAFTIGTSSADAHLRGGARDGGGFRGSLGGVHDGIEGFHGSFRGFHGRFGGDRRFVARGFGFPITDMAVTTVPAAMCMVIPHTPPWLLLRLRLLS
jgi:hypothetical protein